MTESTAKSFPSPLLSEIFQCLLEPLRDGRGLAFLRGLLVDLYALDDIEKMYWGFCSHLEIEVTQNSEAGLIHYVSDAKSRLH